MPGQFRIKIYLAFTWLILTVSLTVWWLYFALGLLEQVASDDTRHRQMLLLEGVTLVGLLIAGGTTLVYFILQERRYSETLKKFFSAFSHDLKTSLASLRLQAESLKEDIQNPEVAPTLNRLVSDASRLQVQVENSLFLGQGKKPQLFMEDLSSQEIVATLKDSWPQLTFSVTAPFQIRADRRAMESVFNNLAHNSLVHGRATEMVFAPQIYKGASSSKNLIEIRVTDNGSGFSGDVQGLGEMHFRQNPSSGSGLGLHIVRELLRLMGGAVEFSPGQSGFAVRLVLEGSL